MAYNIKGSLSVKGTAVIGGVQVDTYDSWDPASIDGPTILSNNNLTATRPGGLGDQGLLKGNFGMSSGKYYWEYNIPSAITGWFFGVANAASVNDGDQNIPGYNPGNGASAKGFGIDYAGGRYKDNVASGNITWGATSGTIGMALDMDNNRIYFTNFAGAWLGGGDPTVPTPSFTVTADTYYIAASVTNTTFLNLKTDQADWIYTVPPGYIAVPGV